MPIIFNGPNGTINCKFLKDEVDHFVIDYLTPENATVGEAISLPKYRKYFPQFYHENEKIKDCDYIIQIPGPVWYDNGWYIESATASGGKLNSFSYPINSTLGCHYIYDGKEYSKNPRQYAVFGMIIPQTGGEILGSTPISREELSNWGSIYNYIGFQSGSIRWSGSKWTTTYASEKAAAFLGKDRDGNLIFQANNFNSSTGDSMVVDNSRVLNDFAALNAKYMCNLEFCNHSDEGTSFFRCIYEKQSDGTFKLTRDLYRNGSSSSPDKWTTFGLLGIKLKNKDQITVTFNGKAGTDWWDLAKDRWSGERVFSIPKNSSIPEEMIVNLKNTSTKMWDSWNTSLNGTGSTVDSTTVFSTDTTVYPKYVDKRVIEFKIDDDSTAYWPTGGNATISVDVKNGGTIGEANFPPDPLSTDTEGHTFLGWYNFNTQVTPDLEINGEFTAKPRWEIKQKYSYTFDLNTSKNPTAKWSVLPTNGTIIEGKPLGNILPPDPTTGKDYTFLGYADAEGNPITKDTILTKDTIIIAQWKYSPVTKYCIYRKTINTSK